ncbi:DUF6350 family protein [Saccharomonospora piscinae]|uniref:cell division protein PerM n=1 Tax=Saccharomonospora piscinae TaxID=687388 RepID=UPI000465EA1B|nr:DUF6350 family protein [Saccharomonospora piscinae]
MGRFTASGFRPLVRRHDVAHAGGTRVLLGVALGPIVTGYAVVASVLVLVSALAPGADLSVGGVLASAAPVWLAAYQVPLTVDGAPLGVLPLVPTIAACVLVFRTAASASRRLAAEEQRTGAGSALSRVAGVVGAVAGAHVLFAGVALALADGAAVRAGLVAATLMPAVLAGSAAALGVIVPSPAGLLDRLDPLAVRGARAGLFGFGGLVVLGLLAFVVSTVMSWSTVGDLFAVYSPEPGSAVGLLLLSVGYVPNAAVLASSVLTGGGFVFGEVSVTAFSMTGGPVPAVPILAALPDEYAGWWPALLVLPAAVGAVVGWSLRWVDDRVPVRLRAVLVAAVVAGFCAVVVAALSGGALGGGAYGPVSVRAEVFSLAAFGFVAVPGGLVAWLAGTRAGRTPRQDQQSGL